MHIIGSLRTYGAGNLLAGTSAVCSKRLTFAKGGGERALSCLTVEVPHAFKLPKTGFGSSRATSRESGVALLRLWPFIGNLTAPVQLPDCA